MPSDVKGPRRYRTRVDPFAAVWEAEVVPLLERDEKGVLEAKTIIETLSQKHEGLFKIGQARTADDQPAIR